MKKKIIVKVDLLEPLKWEDRNITSIELDFSKVNGAMIVEAEQAAGSILNSMVRGTSQTYCASLAASISGIPYRALLMLPGDDFDVVWQTVGAWVNKDDPQKFYDQFTAGDNRGFTEPAETPGKAAPSTSEKQGKN